MSRIDSKHNLNPNYNSNLLWMEVSSYKLMGYTEGQNNFPLEAFSGDNLRNTLSVCDSRLHSTEQNDHVAAEWA